MICPTLLAGPTMYYRITGDLETLCDILATVDTFDTYFLDKGRHGNYFSHLHPASLSPVDDSLGKNSARKNWNSVGDHVPAYLINLLCALDGKKEYKKEYNRLHDMLIFITRDIVNHFPPTDGSKMVFERFFRDWTPDLTYSWQQDRGIVGHNLKIVWNLTRVAFYLENCKGKDADDDLRKSCLDLANKLAIDMDDIGGVDRFRGGCLDALERNPTNGFDLMFTWMSTKDFWQQEQGILAYLILMGANQCDHAQYENFRELAASMSAFYCAFFLDLEHGGVHFRVTDIGAPVITGIYGDKGGHAKSGYHIFELCYLAHIYTLMYNNPAPFTLYYSPVVPANGKLNLAVAPDFVPRHAINFADSHVLVVAKGLDKPISSLLKDFSLEIDLPKKLGGTSVVVQVTLQPATVVPKPEASISRKKGTIGIVLESHYDEKEIEVIDRRLKQEGYDYEFISTLWGQDYLEFQGNECHDPIRVHKDIDKVNIDDYVCFIFIGAYCMDRLYYQENPKENQPNQSPVVNLIRKLANRKKICTTICHSLWAFNCAPEVLKGMKVTCSHNIIDSVQNAGGVVMYQPDGVGTVTTYEHDWLVSGRHGGDTDAVLDVLFAKLCKEHKA